MAMMSCVFQRREAGDGTVLYEMKRRFSDGRQTLRFTTSGMLLVDATWSGTTAFSRPTLGVAAR